MKIFIIGQSGSAKTPFADAISRALNVKFVSASDWLKPITGDAKFKTKQEHIDGLTAVTLRELHKNFDACTDYITATNDLSAPLIIEGMRNPRDFVKMFDFRHDMVIFLNREDNPYRATQFERGIMVIDGYITWAVTNGLLDTERRVNFMFQPKDLDATVKNFIDFFRYKGWCVICGDRGCQHLRSGSGVTSAS